MNWYIEVLKKYAVFSGRARRREYWMFQLIQVLIIIVLFIADLATRGVVGRGLLVNLYSLGTLIPSLAVFTRRMHDTNRSGWYLFIGFIPIIGAIILLVFLAQNGTSGPNDYGPDPKAIPAKPPIGEFAPPLPPA